MDEESHAGRWVSPSREEETENSRALIVSHTIIFGPVR